MQIKITKQTDNPVLKRKEVEADLSFAKATSSEKEVIDDLARQMKADVENIEILKIETIYGSQTAKVTANVYQDKETKAEMRRINKKQLEKQKKAEGAKAEKKEASKKEEKKPEEKPKEEAKPKEEKKPEVKEEKKEEASKKEETSETKVSERGQKSPISDKPKEEAQKP